MQKKAEISRLRSACLRPLDALRRYRLDVDDLAGSVVHRPYQIRAEQPRAVDVREPLFHGVCMGRRSRSGRLPFRPRERRRLRLGERFAFFLLGALRLPFLGERAFLLVGHRAECGIPVFVRVPHIELVRLPVVKPAARPLVGEYPVFAVLAPRLVPGYRASVLASVYFESLPGGEVYPLVPEKIQKFPLYIADTVFQLYLTSLSQQGRALSPPRLFKRHGDWTIRITFADVVFAARSTHALADKTHQG